MNAEPDSEFITFNCECGQEMRVRVKYAGVRGRCKICGRKLVVPMQEPAQGSVEPPFQAARSAEKPSPLDYYTSPFHRRELEETRSEQDLVTHPMEGLIAKKPVEPARDLLTEKKSLFGMLGQILRYPVSDKVSTQIFLAGAILFSPLVWKILVPLQYIPNILPIPLVAEAVALLLAIIFVIIVISIRLMYFSYLLLIIEKSSEGSAKIPELPVFQTWVENLADLLKVLGASVIAFAPFLVYAFSTNIEVLFRMWEAQVRGEAPGADAVGNIFSNLGALGLLYATAAFYMPMVLMTLVVTGSFTRAVNPVHIIRSIVRIRREYVAAMFIILFLLRGSLTLFTILKDILAIDWFTSMVGYIGEPIIEFYALVVTMHVIGLLYYRNGHKLEW